MNNQNQMPYLRTSRSFPVDLNQISIELNKAYVDIANAVNARTIGVFTVNKSAITGESWFFDQNKKQQGSRQVFYFTTTASIPHGINLNFVSRFTRCYGEFTNGTNWYGLISGSDVAILGQVSFYITPTNIVFAVGGGAPSVRSGVVVLEWVSDV